MSKKLPSIITQAIQTIEGFDKVYKVLHQHTVIQGRSQSTFENYIRRITRISLHFNKLPEHISDDEINEYLTALALSSESPSRSSFKHMVYGLRYYFRHMNLPQRVVNLPSIKKEIKLPVILNRSELIELFKAPTLLKHRVLLALAYSAGLRSQEVANLKLSDIDYERKTIHIHQSKFKNDRVSFVYKDSRDHRKDKPITLTGIEFLRRFCMHILPKRFVKIRYYGIMSNRYAKRTILLRKRSSERPKEKESVQQRLKRLTGFNMLLCPFCKKGRMHTIEVVPRIRSPSHVSQLEAKGLLL